MRASKLTVWVEMVVLTSAVLDSIDMQRLMCRNTARTVEGLTITSSPTSKHPHCRNCMGNGNPLEKSIIVCLQKEDKVTASQKCSSRKLAIAQAALC